MRLLRHKWRILFGLTGTILLAVGLFFAYLWFYRLGPARHTLDPKWVYSHSQQEYWREVQEGIHRGEWNHDDGFAVGHYGDKAWAEWIMSHVKPGTSMGCVEGHPATAMRLITNQDVAGGADAWLEWWEKNKSKSQEEWIADGFAQHGAKVNVPPTPEQMPILLALLGSSGGKEPDSFSEVEYNAFRCLRDIGFDPIEYALTHQTIPDDVRQGLIKYGKWYHRYPEAIGVGVLPLRTNDANQTWLIPQMLEPQFQAGAYAMVFAPSVIGAALLAWSLRRRNRRC
jgi:hypothetical protein